MKTIRELGNLTDRIVLITGGAGNLGKAMAEALAEEGASIVFLDMNVDQVEALAKEYSDRFPANHYGLVVDLADKKAIEAVPELIEEKYGKLDVLVNCAALVGSSGLKGWATPFEEQDINTWEQALEVNLTAPFYLVRLLQPLLERSQNPCIINVSSIYGVSGQKMSMYEGMGYLTPGAYAASKGGLVQLTRYLATVLAPKIRVNCISPGGIERAQNSKFVERYENLTPLNRMATEEDFKGVALFLASDLSAYVTGQNIVVDGGWSL